ncbi:hypothetical protein SK128_005136 [Halocaridina rubra]|uniref:Uncharacterized protein n=1 Tax=Halocaridina rubra TaxID=373956 RepID=A0AAN8X4A2_HALRR
MIPEGSSGPGINEPGDPGMTRSPGPRTKPSPLNSSVLILNQNDYQNAFTLPFFSLSRFSKEDIKSSFISHFTECKPLLFAQLLEVLNFTMAQIVPSSKTSSSFLRQSD